MKQLNWEPKTNLEQLITMMVDADMKRVKGEVQILAEVQ